MIQGTFDISIDTPKYHRRGTIALKSEGSSIACRLKVGDVLDRDFTGTCQDKEFDVCGHDDFPGVGEVDYQAHGSVWGNSLEITCQTDAGTIELFGTRLSTSAGDFKSSHEYMMSASTGDVLTGDSAMYSGLYADGS